MTQEKLIEDLDYIKTLAEEGARAPLVGGPIGLMWGVLLTTTFTAQWAVLSGMLDLPESNIGLFWLAFALIGGLGSLLLGRKVSQKPGANSVANRVEQYVWLMFAAMMASLFIGVILNQVLAGGGVKLFDFILIVGFAGQGLAYGVVAKISGIKWMHMAAVAGFTASAICFVALGKPHLYLIAALATLVTVVLPSLITIKREPKHVV